MLTATEAKRVTASDIIARVADIAADHIANAADAVLALEDMRSALLDLVEEYETAASTAPVTGRPGKSCETEAP